ncbi:MAG: hypothetical protein IH852_10295 [Bacteroidetes bacterium]|nr:hypothetical protein [Bacteroidota bacterium]
MQTKFLHKIKWYKSFLVFCVLVVQTLFINQVFAQVEVNLKPAPYNQLYMESLWNLTIINTTQDTLLAYLYATLEEREDGPIANGTSTAFQLLPGLRTFTGADYSWLNPEIDYISSDPRYKDGIMRTGVFPAGDYTYCVYVRLMSNNIDIGDDCMDQTIEMMAAPELIAPYNGATLVNKTPVFTWMHAVTPGTGVNYKIEIVQINDREDPYIAMRNNLIVFEQGNINTTVFQIPVSAIEFLEGKYAWQVIAYDPSGNKLGESDVWSFSVGVEYTPTIDSVKVTCSDSVGICYDFIVWVSNNMAPDPPNGIGSVGEVYLLGVDPPGTVTNVFPLLPVDLLYGDQMTITGTVCYTDAILPPLKFRVSMRDQGNPDDHDSKTTEYVNELPACTCCGGFTREVDLFSYDSTGFLTTNITAGPNPIIKVTAELVYFSVIRGNPDCNTCVKESEQWGNFCAADNIPGFDAPVFTTLPGLSQCSREVTWLSTSTDGSDLSMGAELNMQTGFPPASTLWCCPDTIRLCIRISFTDNLCVTCDTLVCITIERTSDAVNIVSNTLHDLYENNLGVRNVLLAMGTTDTDNSWFGELTGSALNEFGLNLGKTTDYTTYSVNVPKGNSTDLSGGSRLRSTPLFEYNGGWSGPIVSDSPDGIRSETQSDPVEFFTLSKNAGGGANDTESVFRFANFSSVEQSRYEISNSNMMAGPFVFTLPAPGSVWYAGDVMEISWTGGLPSWLVNLNLQKLTPTWRNVNPPIAIEHNNSVQTIFWTIPSTLPFDEDCEFNLYIYNKDNPKEEYTYGPKVCIYAVLDTCSIDAPDSVCMGAYDRLIIDNIIANGFPGSGSYSWELIPDPVNQSPSVCPGGAGTFDIPLGFISISSFIVTPPCRYILRVSRGGCTADTYVDVVSCPCDYIITGGPQTGDTLCAGAQVTITWTGTVPSDYVNLSLIRISNWTTYQQFAPNIPNTGSYDWVIPSDIPCNPMEEWQFYVEDVNKSCWYYGPKFFIKCCVVDTCNCKGSSWGENTIQNITQLNSPILLMNPDTQDTLECNQTYTINSTYNCQPPDCNVPVKYTLVGPITANGNVPFSFTPVQSGTYTLTLFGWCGTEELCDSIVVEFLVECISPDGECCDEFDINVTQDEITDLGGGIYQIIPELIAGPNKITKISATLEYVHVSYNDPECEVCADNSDQFGNLSVDPGQVFTEGGTTLTPALTGPPNLDINWSREVIWQDWGDDGSVDLTGGFSPEIQLKFPPPSPISCCVQTIEFCIRYEFTDENCVTCDTLICYEIVPPDDTCSIAAPDTVCLDSLNNLTIDNIVLSGFPGNGPYTWQLTSGQTGCPDYAGNFSASPGFISISNSGITPPCTYTITVSNDSCTATRDITVIRCTPSGTCQCSTWDSTKVTFDATTIKVWDDGTVTGVIAPQTITITPNLKCVPEDCPPEYDWRYTGPTSGWGTSIPIEITPTKAGTYTVTVLGWCGTMWCDSVRIFVEVDSAATQPCVTVLQASVICLEPQGQNKRYRFTFELNNLTGQQCNLQIVPQIPSSGNISGVSPLSLPPGTTVVTGQLSDWVPANDPFCLRIICRQGTKMCEIVYCLPLPPCDSLCECGEWTDPSQVDYELSGVGPPTTGFATCGETVKDIPFGTTINIDIFIGDFICTGTGSCIAEYVWRILDPEGNLIETGNGKNINAAFRASMTGDYTLIIQPICGSEECPPCVITFDVLKRGLPR